MEQANPVVSPKIKEHVVVGSVKIVEIEHKVKSAVFEDVTVRVPKFVEEQVKVPVGFENVIRELAAQLSESVFEKLSKLVDEKLTEAIKGRLDEIHYPKLVEDLTITHNEIVVEKPVYKDVTVERPVFVDKEVINAIVKDVEVTNAVINYKQVTNAVVKDVVVQNAVVRDVEFERAVIRDKIVDVIHPRYFDLKGNELSAEDIVK